MGQPVVLFSANRSKGMESKGGKTMVTKMKPRDLARFDKSTIGDLLDRQQADADYLKSHCTELLNKYPNHWVVISAGNVAAVENNPRKLLKVLEKLGGKDCLVHFLANPEKPMLL